MNNPELKSFFTDALNLIGWTHVITREEYVYGGVIIPGLRQEVYERGTVSVGVFYYHNVLSYIAWGLKEAEHCSLHARVSPDGKIGKVIDGCPDVTPEINGEGIVSGFTLDGQQVCGIEKVGI